MSCMTFCRVAESPGCAWTYYSSYSISGTLASGTYDKNTAMMLCMQYGLAQCKGITCSNGASCSLRSSTTLVSSPLEISYVPNNDCTESSMLSCDDDVMREHMYDVDSDLELEHYSGMTCQDYNRQYVTYANTPFISESYYGAHCTTADSALGKTSLCGAIAPGSSRLCFCSLPSTVPNLTELSIVRGLTPPVLLDGVWTLGFH